MMKLLRIFPKPDAKRRTLIITAGIVWILAGLMLASRAVIWLSEMETNLYIVISVALVVGFFKNHFMFSKMIKRNLDRVKALSPHKEKVCIFAFQAMQSYLMILVMISGGHMLRLTSIPRDILSTIYLAIGLALFLSGIKYLFASKNFA